MSTIVGGIGPVTCNGLEMNTWHDDKQAMLSLVSINTLKNGVKFYALRECNRATIKSAAQFEKLINEDRIYMYSKKGILIAFHNEALDPEKAGSLRMYCLLKGGTGGKGDFICPNESQGMADAKLIKETKAQLKNISPEFDRN